MATQPGPPPGYHAFAITPSDTTALVNATQKIWVGGAGAVALMLAGDSTAVTFSGVLAGTMLEVCASHVMATGTTATLLVGIY